MIEIALITWEEGRITDVYQTLLNPLVPVSKFIHDLTLIGQRELVDAPKFYEVAEAVALRLEGAVFVSHKVEFDWPMLERAFAQLGRPLKLKTLCTLELAQDLIPGLKSYALEDLCRFFRIPLKEQHRALPDAEACLKLFLELRELTRGAVGTKPRYLPEHEAVLKDLVARPGLLYCFDEAQRAFEIHATDNVLALGQELLAIGAKNKARLKQLRSLRTEVTGSELIAQFRRARFEGRPLRWMITLREHEGLKRLEVAKLKAGEALWRFSSEAVARKKLKALERQLHAGDFAWREGGLSKNEKLALNRALEELVRPQRFPCENLLLWSEGRRLGEWSYVLVRAGRLVGYTYSALPPEQMLQAPDAHIPRRSTAWEEELCIRYLREHRHRRIKHDQWRELAALERPRYGGAQGESHGP